MSIINNKCLLRTSVAAAFLTLTVGTSSAAAPTPPAFNMGRPAQLRHLPGGPDELTFRGETARRSFGVYLTPEDLNLTRAFQIGLRNAVVLLPEGSSLEVSVNGRIIGTVVPQSPTAVSILSMAIQKGTLVPGLNRVEISTTMAHRVDCSVAATYELWTSLDPATTGFVVADAGVRPVHTVEDVAGEALAPDGTMRIALRTPGAPDAASIARAGRFITALVTRAGLVRPIVDLMPADGPGIDVVFTTDPTSDESLKGMRTVGREDGVTFERNADTQRLALVVSGRDEADLDAQVSAFAAKATRRAPGTGGDLAIVDERRLSFADMGVRTTHFAGRHYTAELDVELPADFYPADYGKVRLLIDGAYAAHLDPDSALHFRVNGDLVSSLGLGAERGGVFRHEPVELPLRLFHPGHNDITIEGITTASTDRKCDVAPRGAGAPETRLSIADSSEIDFPHFAHLATVPQIPGVLTGMPTSGRGVLNLYLPDTEPLSVGPGLTVLANMAAHRQDAAASIVVHLGQPKPTDVPGVFVGPWSLLPAKLSTALPAAVEIAEIREGGETREDGGAVTKPVGTDRTDTSPAATQAGSVFDPRALLLGARHLIESQGFFSDSRHDAEIAPVTSRTLLVAAVDPELDGRTTAGIDLPRFTAEAKQWLLVTASDPTVLQSGLDRMISDGRWRELQGQAVSFDVDKGAVASMQPPHVLYIVPQRLALSDITPILGGLVSTHIEFSMAILLLLMALLGVSTHVVVRRAGTK